MTKIVSTLHLAKMVCRVSTHWTECGDEQGSLSHSAYIAASQVGHCDDPWAALPYRQLAQSRNRQTLHDGGRMPWLEI